MIRIPALFNAIPKLWFFDLLYTQFSLESLSYPHNTEEYKEYFRRLAEMYSPINWHTILEALVRYQPDKHFNCSMAILNPLNSLKLEWITVPCNMNISLTNLICETQPRLTASDIVPYSNNVVIYVDATNININMGRPFAKLLKRNDVCNEVNNMGVFEFHVPCSGKWNYSRADIPLNIVQHYVKLAEKFTKRMCPILYSSTSRKRITFCIVSTGVSSINDVTARTSAPDMIYTWTCGIGDVIIGDICVGMAQGPQLDHTILKMLTTTDYETLDSLNKVLAVHNICEIKTEKTQPGCIETPLNITDSSDNEHRISLACGHSQFMCMNTQCIYEGFIQDGRPDCTDASDENMPYLLTFSTVAITNITALSPMMKKVYSKFILRGWPQRQQEMLYPYTRGLLHG